MQGPHSNLFSDLSEIPYIGVDGLPKAYVSASITERAWGNLNPAEKLPYLCQKNYGIDMRCLTVINKVHVVWCIFAGIIYI